MACFGKIISMFLIAVLLLTSTVCASQNTEYADTLYDLGLFRGTDNGYELDRTLTREESATILVRLLGDEDYAISQIYDEEFTDVPKDKWSFPYVMYCYENNITKGTGNSTFSPEKPISAEEFATLLLRLIGYTSAEPDTALKECIYNNMLNSEVVRNLETKSEFLRDDMVYMVYRALMTKTSDGIVLAKVLEEKSVITEKEAEKFDVYNNLDNINDLIDRLLE